MSEKDLEELKAFILNDNIKYLENVAIKKECEKEEYIKMLIKKSIASSD